MGFLIKSAFWFSLVLLALPLDIGSGADGQPKVNAIQALMAAGAAVSDIAGMCERKPDVCETGKLAVSTISARAKVASRIAYESLNDESAGPALESPATEADAVGQLITDATVTGTIPATVDVLPAPAPRH